MRILHVSASYYPAFKFGGPIQSVHLLNKELAKNRVSVDVFTTNAGLRAREDIPVKKWIELDGVRVRYFPYIGYEHYNFSFSLFAMILKEVKNYDLVHITAVWNFPVLAACIACWIHKKPYIISPRGTIYRETIAIKSSLFKRIYYKLFSKKGIDKAAAIHYTSRDEKENVEAYLKVKSPGFVIPNGVDLGEFANQVVPVNEKSKYILFLGRINNKKGLDILLEAFAKIVKLYPELILKIAGPDNDGYQAQLEDLALKLNISGNIDYPGPVHGSQKVAIYKDAMLFVLTSYSENFGMSVVEAMASGCPVLISDKVGIAPEIAENQAGIVVSTNPESIFEGIKSALENDKLRSDLAANGIKTAQNFYSIEGVGAAFIKRYQTIISSWQS